MTARSKWLLAIVGLLAINLVAAVVLAIAANHGGSRVVPEYAREAR